MPEELLELRFKVVKCGTEFGRTKTLKNSFRIGDIRKDFYSDASEFGEKCASTDKIRFFYSGRYLDQDQMSLEQLGIPDRSVLHVFITSQNTNTTSSTNTTKLTNGTSSSTNNSTNGTTLTNSTNGGSSANNGTSTSGSSGWPSGLPTTSDNSEVPSRHSSPIRINMDTLYRGSSLTSSNPVASAALQAAPQASNSVPPSSDSSTSITNNPSAVNRLIRGFFGWQPLREEPFVRNTTSTTERNNYPIVFGNNAAVIGNNAEIVSEHSVGRANNSPGNNPFVSPDGVSPDDASQPPVSEEIQDEIMRNYLRESQLSPGIGAPPGVLVSGGVPPGEFPAEGQQGVPPGVLPELDMWGRPWNPSVPEECRRGYHRDTISIWPTLPGIVCGVCFYPWGMFCCFLHKIKKCQQCGAVMHSC